MCEELKFDAVEAAAAQGREVARLAELVARLEAQLGGGETEPGAGGIRSIGDGPRAAESAAGITAGDELDELSDEDPRIAEIVDAAPPEMRDEVREFARAAVMAGQVARHERAPRSAAQNVRVVGGTAVQRGAFLHCVCIGTPNWGCTGVVVAPQVVLTAAHCGSSIRQIMAGGTSVAPMSSDARVVRVRSVSIHPEYAGHPRSENDITVLILDAPALVPSAPLATSSEIAAARSVEVVGFGYNHPNRPLGFGIKRRATVPGAPIMARNGGGNLGQLPQTLGFHPEYEFVAGRKHLGIDSCNGDSGGPAYVQSGGTFKLAGLTSRATRTAAANCGDGGIYVRPEKFRAWIDEVAAAAGVAPIGR